ncbi:MAG TPA: slipin family protein [Candidatus Sabulitectum sp.]|nr:slipin family protein [Candidatus Sabulitectum sp.]HPJ28440.1 slipin family protein [Candidatus Sabulitectum sp.]HPR22022.1 slipin family protein [Candidatus Sabulitectum sp.]
MGFLCVPAVILGILILSSLRVLKEYQRGVVFRLGKVIGLKGPGLIFVFPVIDSLKKVDLRVITMDVPPQDVITRDNVSVKVNAVTYYRVVDPKKAVLEVTNYMYATNQLAQTTLRSVLGEASLDELLSNRDEINAKLQDILDRMTDPWGIKVSTVEVKHVDLPDSMQRMMAREAEAERDRRAKIIHADAELQASKKLSEAAAIIDEHPSALQLRYLQTLGEIATENNSTIAFPIPIEMMKTFIGHKD